MHPPPPPPKATSMPLTESYLYIAFWVTIGIHNPAWLCMHQYPYTYYQEYYNREGGRVSLYGGHDLYNDIHRLEASVLAVCGHVAKPHVL